MRAIGLGHAGHGFSVLKTWLLLTESLEMKKCYLWGVLAACSLCAQAQQAPAQDGPKISIYGIVDVGLTYVSNEGGKARTKFSSGVNYGNRVGLRGEEDLGGGLKGQLNLEQGFKLGDGTLGQGGAVYGRQAWIGLQSEAWGSLSGGKQYDFVRTYLTQFNYPGYASTYAGHQGDFDRISGAQLKNSVRYVSPDLGGFTFGGMYAHTDEESGSNDQTGNQSGDWSMGAGYKSGNLTLGAAYVRLRDVTVYPSYNGLTQFLGAAAGTTATVDEQRIAGVGISYNFGSYLLAANTTATEFILGSESETQNVYEIGGMQFLGDGWAVVGGYQYTTLDGEYWNQLTVGVRRNLNKRVLIYANLSYLKTSENVYASQGAAFYLMPSSDDTQTTSRVALVYNF